ncbi:thioredoxin-like protein [Polychytrium aggregatum]|uniref:thioredoxin-like protein n=1 Tax=Polychytrium aggregatum TaxID=110093 RepID=UPI0022FEFA4F|nr:thioredoxin-like protein [Polychytrium aggregatum]KAI9204973.1 thioredoxin-like protein [Polychytrium aggregatum]
MSKAFDNDDDELFKELERDEDIDYSNIREKRMEELKREVERLQEMKNNAHGTYENITSEKEVLETCTKTKHVIVHFYHKEFRRCQIVDKHLEILSRKHFKTKFAKVDVESVPFLVERLKIQVLPCIISFVDGISVDRLVGFEELGSTDNFTTAAIEKRLSQSKVITSEGQTTEAAVRSTIFGFQEKIEENDDWE